MNKIIASRLASIEQETKKLSQLKADSEERLELGQSQENNNYPSVYFSIQRTALARELDRMYSTHQDYKIDMDFTQESQSNKLDEQFVNWIEQGWFIEHMEIEKEDEAAPNHSTVYVRLVKL
ncbi:hypothetical protein [Alteromonas stellipolaris]|uniref:hypothetical protein n=1 Tax=Alteromonas stellipolaris TaxID=233316 RepID=UPI0012E33A90